VTDSNQPAAAAVAVAADGGSQPSIAASTYDLLRDRLRAVADRLLGAADKLNDARASVFASVPMELAEQDRLNTKQPSNPRDAVCFNDLLLFGYNVVGALGRGRSVDDAFELFRVSQAAANDWTFTPLVKDDPDWFLSDAGFQRDISELFTYYADTRLIGLHLKSDRLLMVMSVGSSDDDTRVLRWQIEGQHLRYIDAYGDHELSESERYDFNWIEVGRDRLVEGRWRHYNIDDAVFLGLTHGQLELRVDDIVNGGRSILTEPVAEKDQALDEFRVASAVLGDIVLLRVTPYRESDDRYFVYNRLTRAAHRADAIGRNCHQLPEDQGIVFPGGYHLQNGETKVFATNATGYAFHAAHRSPNGEDILYVYHRASTGEYLLCAYNVVNRSMEPPVQCFGYALFDDGVIVCIRSAAEAQRVHTISVYTSPYCSLENYVPEVASDSFMGKIGNPELVRVIGEAMSLGRDAQDPQFNAAVFEALVSRSTALLDNHAWLNAAESHGLGPLLAELRKTAGGVLDEFAAVVAARKEAADLLTNAERKVADLAADAELEVRDAPAYIDRLATARGVLGELSQLVDVRQIDLDALHLLQARVEEVHHKLATRAIEFLDQEGSLSSLLDEIDSTELAVTSAKTSAEVRALAGRVDAAGERIVLLTDVVGALDVEDTTRKTAVLARLSDALARRNTVRAGLEQVVTSLRTTESAAGFQAAMSVLAQRAQAALMTTNDAPACDAALATLSAELENIDLAYGDVSEFADAVATKRDEIYSALNQRRDALAAERTRHIDRLVLSAERVLNTVTERASALPGGAEIDAYFATDGLVAKVQSTIKELGGLGESGRASELDVALATARDQARRTAGDRADLFDAGTVRIGRWKIGVNSEPFELRIVSNDDHDSNAPAFAVRLTGTDLAIPLVDDGLARFASVSAQTYASETPTMPRAMYLAFEAHRANVGPEGIGALATQRINDGYEPGVHDVDARTILEATTAWWTSPALYISGANRAVAAIWISSLAAEDRAGVTRELAAIKALGPGHARQAFIDRHRDALVAIATEAGLGDDFDVLVAVDWLVGHGDDLVISETAGARASEFRSWAAEESLELHEATFAELVRWIHDRFDDEPISVAAEAAWSLLDSRVRTVAGVPAAVTVTGLISAHPLIVGGAMTFDVGIAFTTYLRYQHSGIELFRQFAETRRALMSEQRAALDVDRLRPKVISSFVRNRLVDEVYLPLIGDNIARQLGLNGAAQGLLLLISPPGYGKTTLIEYVCNLLGFALVKINGPALGEQVTSLDPAAAPDAASAEELTKLNRAFAMGNNVVCYIDDIQHASPEFLQKFIPLCDATRRIEGVFNGEARTFNLSGKRFVVAMAGNPYTSSGAAFRIPDMLANRADVHNLGDVAANAADAFAQSYVENACGVNDVLAPVISRGRQDLEVLLRAAGGAQIRSDDLVHRYSANELQEAIKTLGHVARARDALLRVNAAYIASATVSDNLRGEPAFLLQGSYRNMARIAQRIVPAMTPEEVDVLLADHYRAESQTLAADAAWNLTKLAEILGTASPADTARLDEMRDRWREANVTGDPMAVIANALRGIEESLRHNGA